MHHPGGIQSLAHPDSVFINFTQPMQRLMSFFFCSSHTTCGRRRIHRATIFGSAFLIFMGDEPIGNSLPSCNSIGRLENTMFRFTRFSVHCAVVVLGGCILQPQLSQAQSAPSQSDPRTACASDIQKICAGVSPGGGRVLACLKQHKDEVSDGCKNAILTAIGAIRGCCRLYETRQRPCAEHRQLPGSIVRLRSSAERFGPGPHGKIDPCCKIGQGRSGTRHPRRTLRPARSGRHPGRTA